jgi:MTH538 TIR-like domain (DUF1863)
MAQGGSEARGRYVAFISYSHRDAAIGRWLHRRLETYRLPKRLAGSEGEHGPVPARLTPIFRDRDELPAAGDLSERVRAALAVSDNLIVVCSPNSAASPWVTKEIETFRKLHPERPIFTAIIEGEPDQCFAPALREGGIEPLAADLRKEGDGRRLGVLKLVAGLAGVGLDALVQRDAQRRLRRVTMVTLGAVAAMLAMLVLTLLALGARAEAERQRSEAEGLVEFMLTDLRDRLRGVGRLDVLTAVNQRALDYYGDQQALDDLPDDSLERRARILHAMGEDDEKRGDLVRALARFREAHTATAATLRRHPNDRKAIFAHGQSDYWIGRIHELRGSWPEAQRQYAAYAAAAERLIALAPDDPGSMMEMGWGALNLGIVQLNGRKDAAAAESYFATSARWFDRAARADPGNEAARREQANAYAWLADSHYARQLWRQSLHARREEYRIKEWLLRRAPANVDRTYDLAIAERSIARLSGLVGEPGNVRTPLMRAYRRSHRLTARDPGNAEWLLLRTKIECDLLGQTDLDSGVPAANLRRSIEAAAGELSAQDNPRVAEIMPCLTRFRLSRRRPGQRAG